MLIVFRKTFVMRPSDGQDQWRWTFLRALEQDEPDEDELRRLGEGEFKVLKVDPDKAVDVEKESDPLVAHVEVKTPVAKAKLKDLASNGQPG